MTETAAGVEMHTAKDNTSPRRRRNNADASASTADHSALVDELSQELDNLDAPEADTEAEAQLSADEASGSRNPRKRPRASPDTTEFCTLEQVSYDIGDFSPVINVEEDDSLQAQASTPSSAREEIDMKDVPERHPQAGTEA